MRRIAALLALGLLAQASHATIFAYDSGPQGDGVFQSEVFFTFQTDVVDGYVDDLSSSFPSTGLKFFYEGRQYGSGSFQPQGLVGSIHNSIANISFSALPSVEYDPPEGGPHYSGKGAPISFNGSIAAVPELATWALMLGGFGFIGMAARRRKYKTRFA